MSHRHRRVGPRSTCICRLFKGEVPICKKTDPIFLTDPTLRLAIPKQYGDNVYTKVYMTPRAICSADDDDFWCAYPLENGGTIIIVLFPRSVIQLEI